MAWTYEADLVNVPKDWIRFHIGDTNADTPRLSDEEIAALLSINNNNEAQAAKAAMQSILLTLAQQVRVDIGTTKVFASDAYEAYKKQYDAFVTTLEKGNLTVSGIVTSTPIFTIGMHD